MEVINTLLQAIGAVVIAGGGLALIVYQVFKLLSVKWLDSQFDARLQALKHRHDKEIEQLRFKIAALLDRTTKLHEREFEALPEAWSKLNDAYWQARVVISVFKEYPDIDRMISAHQFEFIDGCRLHDWEKAELRATERKNEYYQKHITGHDLFEAKSKSRDAHVFLLKNGIFFGERILEALKKLDGLAWAAIIEHEINVEHGVRPMERKDSTALQNEGEPLLQELQALIRDRLWPKENVGL